MTSTPAPEPILRGTIYLLHFDSPIAAGHTAQHYLGWTKYLPARALAHLRGRGAKITQAAHARGIGFSIVRTWPGDRAFERRLKNRKEGPRLCPICRKAHDARQLVMELQEDLL
jgi:hypothetical protein